MKATLTIDLELTVQDEGQSVRLSSECRIEADHGFVMLTEQDEVLSAILSRTAEHIEGTISEAQNAMF